MPIDVNWGDADETILVWKMDGEWTGTDFYEAASQATALVSSKLYPIDVMVDMRRSINTPRDIIALARGAMRTIPDNVGLTVVIGASHIWAKLYGTLMVTVRGTTPERLQFLPTVDDAYTIIEQHRQNHVNEDDDLED